MSTENFSNNFVTGQTEQNMQSTTIEANTTPVIRSKTDFVRMVLKDIGALSENNPPIGWVHEVEKRLSENNLSMHRNMIYLTRRKMLKPLGKKKHNVPKPVKPAVSHIHNNAEDENSSVFGKSFSQAQLNALRDVQKFATKFGGIQGLQEVVNFLANLKDLQN